MTDITRGRIVAMQLAMMRSEAILVNPSRGGVDDGDAIVEGLLSGGIRGAGLGVH